MCLPIVDKSEADADRERALMDQWVSLTEERNAVMVPSPGSGIPGAPADMYDIIYITHYYSLDEACLSFVITGLFQFYSKSLLVQNNQC